MINITINIIMISPLFILITIMRWGLFGYYYHCYLHHCHHRHHHHLHPPHPHHHLKVGLRAMRPSWFGSSQKLNWNHKQLSATPSSSSSSLLVLLLSSSSSLSSKWSSLPATGSLVQLSTCQSNRSPRMQMLKIDHDHHGEDDCDDDYDDEYDDNSTWMRHCHWRWQRRRCRWR